MSRPRPTAGDKDKGDKDKDKVDKEGVHFNFDVPGLLHSSTNLENLQNFEILCYFPLTLISASREQCLSFLIFSCGLFLSTSSPISVI